MVLGGILAASGLAWLTLVDTGSTYPGSILGPMMVLGLGMGMEFVSLTLMAVSGVEPRESGAASGVLNATQQVGGSLGLSILVTTYGTASRNEADSVLRRFLAEATPGQRARLRRTGELPSPWSDQVLTAGVTSAFVVAAVMAGLAALIALVVIQVRTSDLERLQGGRGIPEADGPPAGPGGRPEPHG